VNDQKKFDICVIGAGSGGLSVAAGAAQMGAKVILIEKHKMGGDCLNYGCVPSKALLSAAKNAHAMTKVDQFGIANQEPDIDFSGVKDHVFDVIGQIEPHDSVERFEKLGVTVIQSAAAFKDEKTVEAGGKSIQAKYFVIATGSRPAIPPVEGLEDIDYLTNETIFDLREKPEHLVIIGGGPIGIEMAQAHSRLGCDVTVLDMGLILPRDDSDLVNIIRQQLLDEGISLKEEAGIKRVQKTAAGLIVHLNDGSQVEGTHLLVAAGRTPNTDSLNLEAAGIEMNGRFIKVDNRLRTNKKRIFAIGDCSGGPMFTHVAGYHAGIVIRNMLFKLPAKVNYDALPWVTYTEPELAQTGLTEEQARKEHGDDIQVTSWPVEDNDRARAEGKKAGMLKVITGKRGKILGASLAAPGAGDLIQPWILALSKGMKMSDIAGIIAPYPTMGEINKRAAGEYYTSWLYGRRMKKIVRFLLKF